MFECYVDTLPDSMCFDSGTDVCRYEDGEDVVEIEVRGYVTVDFKGDRYCHYSDMPLELQKMFQDGTAYDSDEVEILENNWYEVFFNWDEGYDVAEIEDTNIADLESYCKECMDLFKGGN